MRKIFLCIGILILVSHFRSFSQKKEYFFSHAIEDYTSLTKATYVNDGLIWLYKEFSVSIGFNFNFIDSSFSKLIVDSYGDITFGNNNGFVQYGLRIFFASMQDRALNLGTPTPQSPWWFKTDSNDYEKIFKMEWKNAGLDLGNATDYVNCQIWLYEKSETIEFRYGEINITNPTIIFEGSTGPTVGLSKRDTTGGNIYALLLSENPVDPVLITYDTIPKDSIAPTLSGVPEYGTVYRFTRKNVSIEENLISSERRYYFYPNPFNDSFKLLSGTHDFEKIEFFNLQGILVYSLNPEINEPISLSHLPVGCYFFKLKRDHETLYGKIIKI